jgi:tRNA/rRNA methyltransferase
VDFVSFPLRCVIDLVPASEPEEAQKNRAEKRQWLAEHEYKAIEVSTEDVERDLGKALDSLAPIVVGASGG